MSNCGYVIIQLKMADGWFTLLCFNLIFLRNIIEAAAQAKREGGGFEPSTPIWQIFFDFLIN